MLEKMESYIKAISYYLPEGVLTNQMLAKEFPEGSVEKVASKVGVNYRYIVADEETSVDIAVNAAEKLFEENPDINRSDIDFVLFCTQSPDYFLPASACIIQDRLSLRTDIGAFDFNLGCSGYVYGLSVAKGFIAAGIAKNILLLTSDTISKFIHPKDKGNRIIFGDAAAATLVSTDGYAKIGDFSLGTDGGGARNLIVETGAMRNPIRKNDLTFDTGNNPRSSDFLYMDGAEIFNFTLEYVPSLVRDVLLKNSLNQENIDMFVFHQANRLVLNFLRKKIKIEEQKFYYYMENVGNTSSSSIPIALYEAKKEGVLKGNVLIAGFGVGYSWGGTVLTY